MPQHNTTQYDMVFRYLNMSLYPETGVRNQDSYKVKVFMNF